MIIIQKKYIFNKKNFTIELFFNRNHLNKLLTNYLFYLNTIIRNCIIKNNKNQNYIFNSKILEKILKNKMLPKFDGFVLDSRNVKKNNLF